MKKLIVSFSLVLATGLAPVFANGTGNDPRIEKVFSKQFAGAEDVKWTKIDDDFQKVSFVLGGTRAEAYFNSDGELLGTVRNLFFSQLPLVVMQGVNKRYTGTVVTEVKEITNSEGTSYRVVLEQKEKKINL